MDHSPGSALWFRLARTSDGLLCLETISDASLNQPGSSEVWAFKCDVPPHIAKQLTNDHDPGQVVKVLDRALRTLKYT